MNNNNKDNVFEYIKIFLSTLFMALLLVIAILGVIRQQVYNEKANSTAQNNTIDYSLINILIDKNKYLESENPDDYTINIRLGRLYEIKKDYKDAESEYKEAISKAPCTVLEPKCRLAFLYANSNRLDEAQELIDNMDEEPDKWLIRNKAEFYNLLGDKYYNKCDYENAAFRYQKALFYFQSINSDKVQLVKRNLASAYVYLAEQKLGDMELDDAINYLQSAKEIMDVPIIKYKLALLLIVKNPVLADQYLQDVFKDAPELINYDKYSKFLSNLSDEATAQGNIAQADLYKFRMQQLKEYFTTNILSVNDLTVENIETSLALNYWKNKYNADVELDFKNTSKYDIDSLYLYVVFKDGEEIIDTITQQIVDSLSVLKSGAASPTVHFSTSFKKIEENPTPKTITVDVYVSKTEKSYRLHLDTLEIHEKIKNTLTDKMFRLLYKILDKITPKLPAFLF